MSKDLPHFLIIGAQKSGTTSLADALGGHSQAFICEPMEPEFFSKQSAGGRGMSLASYQGLFSKAPSGAVCGEASTGTMLSEKVIPLLDKLVPGVKLVALLRAPEKRAYSAFTHDCKKGRIKVEEQSSIFAEEAERYLSGEDCRFDWFQRSEYGRLLEPFVKHFGARLKVVIFEELVEEPEKGFEALQEFLGLAPEELSLTRENRSRVPKGPLAERGISLGRRLVGPIRGLMSERGYRHFREVLMGKLGKTPDPLDEDLSKRLRSERYGDEIKKLEDQLGRQILAWETV